MKDEVLVNGVGASDTKRLQAVCDHLDIEFALASLQDAWSGVAGGQLPGDRRLRFATLKERVATLELCRTYADGCRSLAHSMAPTKPPIPEPDWLNGQSREWLKLIEVGALEDRLEDANRTVDSCMETLSPLRNLHDAHPIVRELINAIEARNVGDYCEEHVSNTNRVKLRR